MALSSSSPVKTGIRTIDGVLSGYFWVGNVTYSFPRDFSAYGFFYGHDEPLYHFEPASQAMQQAYRFAIAGTGSGDGPQMTLTPLMGFTNISLTEAGIHDSGADADIRIASSSVPDTAYAYLPASEATAGDVWFGQSYEFERLKVGSYEYVTAIHELGHALGLKHPHEIDRQGDVTVPLREDFLEYTVMSYRSYKGQDIDGYTNEDFGYPQTYMMDDIAALQTLYGANFSFRPGNTTYSWDPKTGEAFVDGAGQGRPGSNHVTGATANRIFETIWDGGGTDTYDLSRYTTSLSIDLNPGAYSTFSKSQQALLGDHVRARGNVYNSRLYQGDPRSVIENAKGGAGSDAIKGNGLANRLEGHAGNDTLMGGPGADTLDGGRGKDTASYANASSAFIVNLTPDETGHGASSDGDALLMMENVIGSRYRDQLIGNRGGNVIDGGPGSDILIGGSGKDVFAFTAGLNRKTNIDTIADFLPRDDTIRLDHVLFQTLGRKSGILPSGAFWIGRKAHDAGDRIIYNGKTGLLSYDQDGSGHKAAVAFANLEKNLHPTYRDFHIV